MYTFQQLEYLNLSAFILTDKDIIHTLSSDPNKIVSAKGICNALANISNTISSTYANKDILDLYAKIDEVSSKNELSEEFQKYQEKNDYALKNEVSSKQELADAFNRCSKISVNVSSDVELAEEFRKYAKADQLKQYALKTNVSSVQQLTDKFKKIEQISDLFVKLSGDSTIDGNINIRKCLMLNEMYSDFSAIQNLEEMLILSNHVNVIDLTEDDFEFESTLLELGSKVNEVIICYGLNISLLKKNNDLDTIVQKINAFCELTDTPKIGSEYMLKAVIDTLNENIVKFNAALMHTYAENIAQSLSAISQFSMQNRIYDKYLNNVLNEIVFKIKDFCTKDSISSAYELSEKFNEIYVKNDTLSTQQIYDLISKYALSADVKDNVSKQFVLNALQKYALICQLSSYALSSEVSSAKEIADAFKQFQVSGEYALKSEVSTKYQLANEFKRYQLSGNYALKNEVSSKQELADAFNRCSKISVNVSSDVELAEEFRKYAKADQLKQYALKTNVSSVYQLKNKFDEIDNSLETVAVLTNDNTFQKNINVAESVTANSLCVNFANVLNDSRNILLKTEISHCDDYDTVYGLCQKINEAVIMYSLSVDVIDVTTFTENMSIDLTDALNSMCDIVHIEHITNSSDTIEISKCLNRCISLLNSNTLCQNLMQSLSAIADKTLVNKRYIDYVKTIVDDNVIKINGLCPKSYTSSVIELNEAFSKYASKDSTYDKSQIDLMLEKYAYADNVSSCTELDSEFSKYAKREQLANYAKSNDLSSYALCTDIGGALMAYAKQADVSSANQLSCKFSNIEKQLSCDQHEISTTKKVLYNDTYRKQETMSTVQIEKALNDKQDSGDYLERSELAAYATEEYVNSNFAKLSSDNSISGNQIFEGNVTICNAYAKRLNIDFAELYNDKDDLYLSSYLYLLTDASEERLVSRINDIIIYCKYSDIPLIQNDVDIREKIISKTNSICEKAGLGKPVSEEDPDWKISCKNALDKAIQKIQLDCGPALESILKAHQYRNLALAHFSYVNRQMISSVVKHTDSLSDYAFLSDVQQLSVSVKDISSEISSKLSTLATSDDLSSAICHLSSCVSADVNELSAEISSVNDRMTVLNNTLSDYTLLSDSASISSMINQISDIISTYYCTKEKLNELQDSLTDYVKVDSITNTLALSAYSDLKLEDTFSKKGTYVSCTADASQRVYGEMPISGYYADGTKFSFIVLTSDNYASE